MNIELTEAQLRKANALLSRIESASRGDLKMYNTARLIGVELRKSERRAKRSAQRATKVQNKQIIIAASEDAQNEQQLQLFQ